MKLRSCIVIVMVTSSANAADLGLNLLDNCGVVADAYASVQSRSMPGGTACRRGSGAVEKALLGAVGPSAENLCFLREPPVVALERFQCLRFSAQGETPLVCYRPIELTDIASYERNYKERESVRSNAYLERARRCSASNGDTAAAGPTLMPSLLAVVGKSEVAFISTLGTAKPANSAAVHGFATSSPEMKAAGIEAFEYFSVYRAAAPMVVEPGDLHGKWRVKIDDGNEVVSEIERQARKAGGRLQARLIGMEIHRDINAEPYSQSDSVTKRLAARVLQSLEREGFEEIDADEVASHAGLKGGDLISMIRGGVPYGNRALGLGLDGKNLSVKVLMKTGGAMACVKGDRGAFGAGVVRMDGHEGERDDFGSVFVLVFGVGACSQGLEPQRRFLDELVSNSKEKVLASLPD